jgi:hypothetical protein
MRISRYVLVGCTLVACARAGLWGQDETGRTSADRAVTQEGAMESRGIQSHAGGAVVQTGGGGSYGGMAVGAMGGPPPRVVTTGRSYGFQVRTGDGMPQPSVIVVPTSKVDAGAFTQTAGDVQVMSHILRQNLSKGRGSITTAVFTDYGDLLGADRPRMDGLYVQGYGAFLFVEVRLAPPAAPAGQAGQGQDKGSAADPVWEHARQELNRPEGPAMGMGDVYGGAAAGPYGGSVQAGGSPEDGWEMQELTAEVIRTFKHAANIRHLEPTETVTVSVTGRPVAPGGHYVVRRQIVTADGPMQDSLEQRGEPAGAGTTTTTFQAKKSDIDQFAQGKLSLDQFRQKVKVFTY